MFKRIENPEVYSKAFREAVEAGFSLFKNKPKFESLFTLCSSDDRGDKKLPNIIEPCKYRDTSSESFYIGVLEGGFYVIVSCGGGTLYYFRK